MAFLDTLRNAHIKKHRVGHVCGDDSLTEPEQEVFERLKTASGWEITVDGITAKLEPRRFGVNWRRELLELKGEAYVRRLAGEAQQRTLEAKQKFQEEAPDWSEETLKKMRLVIIG